MGNAEVGVRNGECGMRPPASPSCRLYEPEAVGAIGVYAPEGSGTRRRPIERDYAAAKDAECGKDDYGGPR
jgi:hypothetical protein